MYSMREKWFQKLLYDMFGVSVEVRSFGPDQWEFTAPQSSVKLILPRLESKFPIGRSDIPCVTWLSRQINLGDSSPRSIPAPGLSETQPFVFLETEENSYFNYDVLSLAWWCLSRSEEVARADLDHFGRFVSTSSHAFRNNYLDRPIVDEWLNLLFKAFVRVWPNIDYSVSQYSLSLSHDVDRPGRFTFSNVPRLIKRSLIDIYRNQSANEFLKVAKIVASRKRGIHTYDPYNTFDWLMDQSERLGTKSTFYFLAGLTSAQYDADYELGDPRMRELLRKIDRRGHKIGLHPSFDTYLSPENLHREVESISHIASQEDINLAPLDSRMHYLRFSMPETLVSLSRFGVKKDSTLGYADRPGFRCGTCHPYQAIDAKSGDTLPMKIEPLIAMDVSFYKHNLTLAETEEKLEYARKLKSECFRVNGVFSLLWHNSELWSESSKNFYKGIIAD